jgi:uncharacterized protein (DUF983 family)
MVSKYDYVNVKLSRTSRELIDEICSVTRYVKMKDVIALAWPRCPKCGGPVVQKFASTNLICVRCRTEYKLAEAHV